MTNMCNKIGQINFSFISSDFIKAVGWTSTLYFAKV